MEYLGISLCVFERGPCIRELSRVFDVDERWIAFCDLPTRRSARPNICLVGVIRLSTVKRDW